MNNRITGETPRVRWILQILLQNVNKHIGKTSEQLYDDFVSDYGSVGKRPFYRYLKALIGKNCIRRDDECNFDFEVGALRPMYFLVSQIIPRPRRMRQSGVKHEFICPRCGQWRAAERSHPEHRSSQKVARIWLNKRRAAEIHPVGASTHRPERSAAKPPGRTIALMSTAPHPGADIG